MNNIAPSVLQKLGVPGMRHDLRARGDDLVMEVYVWVIVALYEDDEEINDGVLSVLES